MTIHVRCGTLFTGNTTPPKSGVTIAFGDDGKITHVSDTTTAPEVEPQDNVLDSSGLFVMPGLIDVHTHRAAGNRNTEEVIVWYRPMEFPAPRALFFAPKGV